MGNEETGIPEIHIKECKFCKERNKNWQSHRWYGWPGNFCQDCFIDDPLEEAVAFNIEDTHKWSCEKCTKKYKE